MQDTLKIVQEKLKQANIKSYFDKNDNSCLRIQPKKPYYQGEYMCFLLDSGTSIDLFLTNDHYTDYAQGWDDDSNLNDIDAPLVLSNPERAKDLIKILQIVGPYLEEDAY